MIKSRRKKDEEKEYRNNQQPQPYIKNKIKVETVNAISTDTASKGLVDTATTKTCTANKGQVNKEEDSDDDAIDDNLKNLITNLKIISNIHDGDKIYMNECNIIEIDKSTFPSLSRYYYSRGRHDTINFLKELVTKILLSTDTILQNEVNSTHISTTYNSNTNSNDFTDINSDILQRFILEINKSFIGLDNLIHTYKDDITIVSEIQVLKEQLHTRCTKIISILRIKKQS